MRSRPGLRLGLLAIAVLCLGLAGPTAAGAAGKLQMYEAVVDQDRFNELLAGGYDVINPQQTADGVAVDLVLSPRERTRLDTQGVDLELLRDEQGRTARQAAAAQAEGGFQVWRDYDGADGLRRWMYRFAERHRSIADLRVIGETHQGREILAIELTKGGGHKGKGKGKSRKPAVLYQGTTHAREWISTEVTRRLMTWFARKSSTERVRRLLKTRELWFVPVVNPDGYQYTFDEERLWRKNLSDNNGDGEITNVDGVDLNRNYPEHWNYDDEGSSTETTSETYRGTEPGSEPETQAGIELFDRVPFKLANSYHSYGPLLLYPEGWQVQTPARDLPIYIALSGTDEEPAIEGFDPDVSAELYTTNGEFTDWAHGEQDALAWTTELNEGCEGCEFVFPDDPALVRREAKINRPFALDMARSAANTERPKSHLGNRTKPFYLEAVSDDPTFANNPLADFRFSHSYGDPQPVEVLARRSLGKVNVHYRINGGRERTAPTSAWNGGENFGEGYDAYYHLLRGEVGGTDPGDEVEVWFEPKSKKGKRARRSSSAESDSFTYEAVSESDADTLVVAAEDYSGISNDPPYASADAPNYLSFFEQALDANGIEHEVYDVDARGRVAPDALGVLSHFDAVAWYTGNDVITRDPGMVPGTASRLANDEMLEMRSYLNEGGKLLYNGQNAGLQYAFGFPFDPVANAPCFAGDDEVDARCQAMSDDFLQYYLGAYLYNDNAGTDPDTGNPFDVVGTGDPYTGLDWSLNGPGSADNQVHTASFLSTSSLLPESQYPQFASDAPAAWAREGAAPFRPIDGSHYVYSHRADQSYKRLTRTIDLTGLSPGEAADLSFQISRDTEPAWDFVFVEANPVGEDEWTTLPDESEEGHTDQDTGASCPANWHSIHPWLERYQTLNADDTCSPTGTSGEWNAASGRSDGWEEWRVDLSEYAGDEVEISISYASDFAVQGIGAFVDQIEVSTGEGTTSFEDDGGADPMDGWTVAGAPEGSGTNPNDWERTTDVKFEEGAAVSTDDSLYFGFGLEGVASPEKRAQVMGRSMDYLLGP
ncbi:MAG: M14 family zinc carboxypeptidase [Solirubrobacterales bacterium]